MIVELRGRSDRLLVTCQAMVPTLVILMTTVSCSRPDMPEPRVGIFEPLFSSPVIDTAKPKATSVLRPTSKKANTPPRLNSQKEQQLFQEFMEWRKRQKDPP